MGNHFQESPDSHFLNGDEWKDFSKDSCNQAYSSKHEIIDVLDLN